MEYLSLKLAKKSISRYLLIKEQFAQKKKALMKSSKIEDYPLIIQKAIILRVRIVCITAVVLYISFNLLDQIVYPEHANFFLLIRFIVSALLIGIYACSYIPIIKKYSVWLSNLVVFLCAFGILLMINHTDKSASSYYQGINLTFLGLFTMNSFFMLHNLIVGALILAIYNLFIWEGVEATYLTNAATSNFFMFSTLVFVGILTKLFALQHHKEYLKTKEVEESNQKLNDQITERKKAAEALKQSQAQLSSFLDNATAVISMKDVHGRYQLVNRAFEKLYNIDRENIQNKTDEDILPPDKIEQIKSNEKEVLKFGKPLEFEEIFTQEGKDLAFFSIRFPLFGVNGEIYATCCISTDITERKKAEELLRYLSMNDELTGLYNRRGFIQMAENNLKEAKRNGDELVLFFADMDKLKQVNDTLGHSQGDMAIINIAKILKKTFREGDVIARFGGDEFAILLTSVSKNSLTQSKKRLQENITQFNAEEDLPYKLSLTVGSCLISAKNITSIDQVMDQADQKLYELKRIKTQNAPDSPIRSKN